MDTPTTPKATSKILAKETIKLFYHAMTEFKILLILSLALPIGMVLLSIGVPYYAGKVLAGIIQHRPLTTPLILLAVVSFLGVVGNRVGFGSLVTLQAKTMTRLHTMVFSRLLQRSVGFHSNNISGKLISDAIDFVASYLNFVNSAYTTGAAFAGSVVIGLVIVWVNSWQLGAFVTAIVTVVIFWAWLDSRKRSGLRSRRLIASKRLTAHLSDTLVNTQTVKMFSREEFEIARNASLNAALEKLRIHDWNYSGRSASNRIGALLVMQFFMILLIIHLTRRDPATLATGIFAFTYTLTLSNRLFEINTITRQIEESFLQSSPMAAMLREPVEVQNQRGAKKLVVTRGAVDVSDVAFAYAETSGEAAVFRDLSLQIAPGEKIGLVGPSGGGKSTLTRLLLRFDDIQQGSIAIDGQNIAEVTQSSLRQAIAYVPQEPLLFHRSIRENIAYGRPNATEAEVIGAAKKANAHEFILGLSKGYDTIVGERGVKLSGGQRQRVAIARAILKDAPILVLDEATSALDSESEGLIQGALWELMEKRTAIVIAHRLSTIQKMDRIIVLHEGTIVEEGSHKQLLKQKGLYARLWSHQSGGFIEE